MARIEIIRITCDICGTELDSDQSRRERAFSVDGQPYTIDLCVTHTAELDSALSAFTDAGRTTPAGPARTGRGPARRRSARTGGSPKEIRDWARANGFARVSDRGRVPGDVLAAWHAVHSGSGGSGEGAEGGDGTGTAESTVGSEGSPEAPARASRRAAGSRKARSPRKAAAAKRAAPLE